MKYYKNLNVEDSIFFVTQREKVLFFSKEKDKNIEESIYDKIIQIIKEETKIKLSLKQVIDFIDYFPLLKIEISNTKIYDSFNKNCIKNKILNHLSLYLLGIDANFNDKNEKEQISNMLLKQAKLLNLKTYT